jgi:molecular chaperone HscB
VNLQSNDFELFEIEQCFAQDRGVLDRHWKDLQRGAHPDKFAAADGAAQRVAMQWSVRINEAYQRLKDPLKRAAYLCDLAGSPVNAHTNTSMPVDFLMLQMQWRESLEEAQTIHALDALRHDVDAQRKQLLVSCAEQIDVAKNYDVAVQSVRKLMFIEKFAVDMDRAFEKFD